MLVHGGSGDWGSSPLARGTRFFLDFPPFQLGLIPARAGNTQRNDGGGSYVRAHPRSRGEHMDLLGILLVAWGSSPLARGTPTVRAPVFRPAGLIPARAGNTCFRLSVRLASRAHPRSRGEHSGHESVGCHLEGSSPLARGTQEIIEDDKYCLGLIPARAGNTGYGFCGADHAWAHPRSRGEHRMAD